MIDKNKLLPIALVFSLIVYGFWKSFPKGSFYYGNALFIVMLCLFINLIVKQSKEYKLFSLVRFVSFSLLCYSLNNLADEIIFEPGVFGWNEKVFAVAVPLIWIIKTKLYARQIPSAK